MDKQQEPRLRFQGFAGAWEEKVLGELGYCFSGIGFPENEQGRENGIPFFKVSDMNLLGNEIYLRKANNYVTQEQIDKQRWQVIQQLPCIFFAKIGAALLLNRKRLVCKPFLLDNNTMAFILSLNLDDYFIKTLFDTIDLPALAQIGALPSISAKDIEKNIVFIPTSREQTAIGNFFRRLDSQIAESRAVLEKSRQLKKAMLAKMFPANGEKIPKIRFKGFEGEWECRKFSEVAELRRGLTYSPLDISQNGIRVLRSSNIDEEYYIEKNDDVFVCERAVNIPLAQNGDILITAANGSSRLVGKHAIIQTSIPAVHGGFMLLARTENPYFLNASMSSAWYLDFIRIFVAGGNGAIGNLSIGDLNEQEILIPKHPEEQTAIGNFFRQLDETIALQSAEVEKLNQLKKGLLAAMLV